MVEAMYQGLDQMLAIKLKEITKLPLIWREFYTVPVDGVSNRSSHVFKELDKRARDNQEVVDYFESQMRTVGLGYASGFFLWSVNLSKSAGANSQDAIKQPPLINAIATWWGGDVAFFASCLTSETQTRVLLRADFEKVPCPLETQDSFTNDTSWDVTEDPTDSTNRVLRGRQWSSPPIPVVGRLGWTDYTIKLRVRLAAEPVPPAAAVNLRVGVGHDNYGVHLGFDQVSLIKHLNTQGQHITLANYTVPGGLHTNRWYTLHIEAVGANLAVKLDGEEILRAHDKENPLLKGGVALFAGSGLGPATVHFDDIVIETVGG